jgi:hypothetical protein
MDGANSACPQKGFVIGIIKIDNQHQVDNQSQVDNHKLGTG